MDSLPFGLDYRLPIIGNPDKLWRSRQLPLNYKYNTFVHVCQVIRCLFGSDELVPHAHRPVATSRPCITVSQLPNNLNITHLYKFVKSFGICSVLAKRQKEGRLYRAAPQAAIAYGRVPMHGRPICHLWSAIRKWLSALNSPASVAFRLWRSTTLTNKYNTFI